MKTKLHPPNDVIILCGHFAYIFSDTTIPKDILPHFANEGIEAWKDYASYTLRLSISK